MRRREKPLKAKGSPGRRPASTTAGAGRRDLETRLAEARKREATAFEQQAATGEILRVISRSPADVQPVFDAIVKSALRLCDGVFSIVLRFDGEYLHLGAEQNFSPEALAAYRRWFPRRAVDDHLVGRCLLERRVMNVADVTSEFRFVSGQQEQGFRSALFVPMVRDGIGIGVIGVSRMVVGPFPEHQVELLQTFADQAVIAVENVRLFKELHEKNTSLTVAHSQVTAALERQTATSEILRVISQSPTDVQPVFDTIVRNAVELCHARASWIWVMEGDWLRIVAPYNVPSDFPDGMTIGEVPNAARVIREGIILNIGDTQDADDLRMTPTARRWADALGTRALLTVPLRRGLEAIGALTVHRTTPGTFSVPQVELLETFADQAVIAIENVRLFKALETRNADLTEALDQQTATSEVLRVISSSPTAVQPVFDAIAASATRLCHGLYGLVFRFDGELITLAAEYGSSRERMEVIRSAYPRPPGRGSVAAQAILERRVIAIADAQNGAEFPHLAERAKAIGYHSIVSVPMLLSDTAIGAINVVRVEAMPFTEAQIALLETFADQAVIAIENVRLFQELQARNRELTQALDREAATGEILRVINSSPTTADPVFDAILERGMRLCRADVGLLVLTEEDTFRLVAHRGAPAAFVEPRRHAFRSGPHTGLTRAVQERRPVHIEDLTADVAYIEGDATRLQTLQILGARTGVWVPLLREAEPVGVLVTWRREVRPFTAAEIDILTTFANQAVIALENVRLLRELKDKSQQLEAASQHKSEFLANMSHELRTPLNAIIGFSEVLAQRMFGELNDKQDEYLRDIHASGQHLLSLINDILDLSKIEAGRMELEPADFDLPGAIDNALILVRERAGRRGIALGRKVDVQVGAILADERKVKQVLLNLLSNAIKFTPEGGRVDVRAAVKDGFAEVSVIDTGIGIAPEDQEAVFEEFRQVGTAAKKVEGTGLGLTLSRKFVELHGGRIWVRSRVGEGSTFTFTLPIQRGAD
jgi:two-component system, NtrC family, sensor kinase